LDPQIFYLLSSEIPGRLFGLDAQTVRQIIAQSINLVVLAFVLSKLLYKPVREMLLQRTARIRDQLNDAEKEKASALELKAEYESYMKNVEREKDEILDAARKLATEKSNEQLASARTEADATKTRAFREIEMEQERVRDEMKQAVINVSSAMVAKFLTRTIDAAEHDRLFDETMAELEEIPWQN
jgi:F-type H+-transporting ATPase subunit b